MSKLCAREGCDHPVKRARNKYCSHSCACFCTPPIHLRPRRKKAEPITPQQAAILHAEMIYAKVRRDYGVPPYRLTGRTRKKRVGLQGERNPRVKLTRAEAMSIRVSDLPTYQLAEQYGVNRTTIQKIRNGKSWASL